MANFATIIQVGCFMGNMIGTNLEKLREANRLTQSQVANYLGIQRSAYANYESSLREPPLEILEKAASLFGCELSLILEEDENVVDNMLVTAFRVDNLSKDDMNEVAAFKNVVINYLKMERLLA